MARALPAAATTASGTRRKNNVCFSRGAAEYAEFALSISSLGDTSAHSAASRENSAPFYVFCRFPAAMSQKVRNFAPEKTASQLPSHVAERECCGKRGGWGKAADKTEMQEHH